MKAIELYDMFKIEAKAHNIPTSMLVTDDVFHYLNIAVRQFINNTVEGINIKRRGFEEDQKRIDELGALVRSYVIDNSNNDLTEEQLGTYPPDYDRLLRIELVMSTVDCGEVTAEPDFVQHDDYSKRLDDPFNTPILTEPIYTVVGNKLKYVTKDVDFIKTVTMIYLSKVKTLTINNILDKKYSYKEYTNDYPLPESTYPKVIKMAIAEYLKPKNEGDGYTVNKNEINTNE